MSRPSSAGDNLASKDDSPLRDKYRLDKLVVLQVVSVGFERTYLDYFPLTEPKAHIGVTVYLVNLSTNRYEWYLQFDMLNAAQGPWDEPPDFPALTSAFSQVIEEGQDGLLKPFDE